MPDLLKYRKWFGTPTDGLLLDFAKPYTPPKWTLCHNGINFAKQIYEEISDGFVEKIRAKLKKNISIPDEKKISCSIGIASFMGGSRDEFELALNRLKRVKLKKHSPQQQKSAVKFFYPLSISTYVM